MNKSWYTNKVNEVIKALHSNATTGLSSETVHLHTQKYGKNKGIQSQKPSIFTVFLGQFADPLIYLLACAAFLIYAVGQRMDAFVIIGILFFNAIIGTFQEYRTFSLLTQLTNFLATKTLVVRNGKQQVIDSHDLVPGDLVIVQSGSQVPADIKLTKALDLHANEAIITGESHPVPKFATDSHNQDVLLEQPNILFQGSFITSGQGEGIVIATGQHTQAGLMQATTNNIKTDAPIKKDLQKLSRVILAFTLLICTTLFLLGLWQGKAVSELFTMLTALFICVVPEGLPVVMTLIMISGAYRMAKHNILVKRLKALEALGRTSIIIVDKTGTLTKNELIAQNLWTPAGTAFVSGKGYDPQGEIQGPKEQDVHLQHISTAAMLSNNTHIEKNETTGTYTIQGNPTHAALYILAQKYGLTAENVKKEYTIEKQEPFTSEKKYSLVQARNANKLVTYIIGAPEVIFKQCTDIPTSAYSSLETFLSQGARVIAIAHATNNDNAYHIDGLISITDSLRDNIADIIQETEQAGIHTIMATGDHTQTAQYIAARAGLTNDNSATITGSMLSEMDDKTVHTFMQKQTVFARLSPQDKLRLVTIAQQGNTIVTMTGDGINDIPALVAADVGIAMGSVGTQVTKQAADVILLNDSFENIIHGIKEGSTMFLSLRRTILYFMASNMGEVLIIFFAMALNLSLPILASQILWLNLVTDGFLDMALSMEPNTQPSIKYIKDMPKQIIDMSMIWRMLYLSIPMSLISLAIFCWYKSINLTLARTITLQTLAMFQWFNAWNCRSEQISVFKLPLFANPWLILATSTVLLLQIAIVYVPWMNTVFQTTPLSWHHWLVSLSAGSCALLLSELQKYVMHKG